MSENTLVPVLDTFNRLFDNLNEMMFESNLEKPIISVVPLRGHNLRITQGRVWDDNELSASKSEFAFNAHDLGKPFDKVVEIMMHGMVHLYDLQNGINDRNGYYHNKNFKNSAERFGLICERGKYGWDATSLGDKGRFILSLLREDDFKIQRVLAPRSQNNLQFKSRLFVYRCPVCGAVVKSRKAVNVACLCNGNINRFEVVSEPD